MRVRNGQLPQLLIVCTLIATVSANAAVLAGQVPTGTTGQSTPPGQAATMVEREAGTSATLLKSLIDEALANNPEIKAMQRNVDMMRARVPQAKALPDPMLTVGTTGNIVPIPPFDIQKGDPSSARALGFTQELPFPGKRSLRGKMSNFEAEAEWWNYEQSRLNLVAEVKDAYFDLYFVTKAIDTVSKNKDLLDKFAKIAAARYSVGKGIQQDVLKAQVEISKLTEQLALLDERKLTTEARLNSLLYREPELPIGKPEEINSRDFPYGLAQLTESALTNYPGLKAQKRKIDREQTALQLARKDLYPDFSVGVTYLNRPGLPNMYSFNIGVKIPLYFREKQRPAISEAASSEAAEQNRFENLKAQLFFRIKDRYLSAITAQRLVKLYGTTIIPQSSLALESAISSYEVGGVDFLTLLDNIVTLRNYELSYYEQLSNQEKAVAALEPLVGITLRP